MKQFISPHPDIGALYNLEPAYYKDCRIYRAFFRTDPQKLLSLLPAGVEPLEPGELFVYGASLPLQGSAGIYGETLEAHAYTEFGLVAPCRVHKPDGATADGMYALALYFDPFVYATPGRERWGWPKKDGNGTIELLNTGAGAQLVLNRNSHLLIRTKLEFSQPVAASGLSAPITLDEVWFNWKTIPSVTGMEFDVSQLTAAILPVTLHGYSEGVVKSLELCNGPADFLADALPILSVGKAVYLQADFTLPNGVVVFDYLQSR
jgi:acetoacetate decarboxylase